MDYSQLEELVELSKKGDKKAREKLVEKTLNKIGSIIKKYNIYPYSNDDMINEAYKVIFENIDYYDHCVGNFLPFMELCINRHFSNLLRKSLNGKLKDGVKTLIIDEKFENILFYKMKYFDGKIIKDDRIDSLSLAFRTILTKEEQEILYYKYFLKKTLKEYAENNGLSYSTIKRSKKRALIKLKKFIEKELNL
ncbi:sigma-70 family RNA polymerase sigma factor [Clostridium intestinale]|uniref:Sigma-70 family RNA polymerase sigma factor n=1 Tax=Clostridium intestinale TaxID=36845 RepID=A0A7D6VNF7_9CLOT|nr:sigma-70 family RNA polymerase sigma factor [Clostridium intestinale]QLY79096.1 sigma-70 family RNA polymerase sigma factor [Clostridium intestinale]